MISEKSSSFGNGMCWQVWETWKRKSALFRDSIQRSYCLIKHAFFFLKVTRWEAKGSRNMQFSKLSEAVFSTVRPTWDPQVLNSTNKRVSLVSKL